MLIGINAIFLAPGKGGGMERYLVNMVRAMAQTAKGDELIAFACREGLPGLEGTVPVIKGPISAQTRWARVLWEQVLLPGIIKDSHCDAVLSFGNICPVRLSLPSLLVMHDAIPFEPIHGFSALEKTAMQTLFRASARSADRIVTVSEFSKKRISEHTGVSRDKVSIIPGACDPVFFPQETSRKKSGDYILASASARPHKNLDRLLQAYKILVQDKKVNAPLVLVHTQGSEEIALDKARRLGLGNKVIAFGKTIDGELAGLYGNAALFVYPSLYEGFGLPILEAMTSGTPVIASRAGAIPETAGNAALLFDPCNPEELAQAMERVLKDPITQKEMIERGKNRAREFSWENSATAMLALAREAAGKRR
ncbi:glycosyl transferase group 1 [Desulfatibacillum aliphaticivorans]|uniref:Glycosyl transferase group 1 n=1 Tax=Desulfatibacillum aliphaticivorans TaxID=218208 RepID=B8FIC3_DESAL|nr:glycosyltransferase family 1 protein [Desulfatibacillum aliphaticivorans]ACL03913.1 glycosyl transferase group 1 [Desulfatibacillum aliphaticivorans]